MKHLKVPKSLDLVADEVGEESQRIRDALRKNNRDVIMKTKWWKFDFHVHTPASLDYVQEGVTSEQWLRTAMERELDAVVVADHNSAGWIDELKSTYKKICETKPSWFRELVIFPGFELSVNGGNRRFHLLGVFDPSANGDVVKQVLSNCAIDPTRYGDPHLSSDRGFVKAVELINAANGIAIPAHVNANSEGLLSGCQSLCEDLERTLKLLYAAEFCNVPHYNDARLQQAVEKLAMVGGSDAHQLVGDPTTNRKGIGDHYVWVKLGCPCISALRMALLDPEDCVRDAGVYSASAPDFWLKRMEVSGLNCGGSEESSEFSCEFHQNMTAIIGGRGAGKSMVLRCVRLVMHQYDDNDNALGEDEDWQRFVACADQAKILLEFESFGHCFRIVREQSQERLEEQNGSAWATVQTGDIRTRFPTLIFGQKQIFELASKPDELLRRIDDSSEVDRNSWDAKWSETHNKYLSLKLQERDLQCQLLREDALTIEIGDLNRRISDYETRGSGDVLRRYQIASSQQTSLSVTFGVEQWIADVRAEVERCVDITFPDSLFNNDERATTELRSLVDGFNSKLASVRQGIAAQLDALGRETENYRKGIEASEWASTRNSINEQYNQLRESCGGDLNLNSYQEWVAQRNEKLAEKADLEAKRNTLNDVVVERCATFEKLIELRHELKKRRKKFITNAIGQSRYVRFNVRPYGDMRSLEKRLRAAFNSDDDRFRESVDALIRPLITWRTEGVAGVSGDVLLQRLKKLKEEVLSYATGATTDGNWRFMKRLQDAYKTSPEGFDAFEAWLPEDALEIEYAMNDGLFRPLASGSSAGQKSTAILSFLLSYGCQPILIDQPEDDLDNKLISSLVVKQIRDQKRKRQIVVVTHNPNIVVNGGTESVVVMKYEVGKVGVAAEGPLDVDELKQNICDIMEGGKIAFQTRFEREIGHVGNRNFNARADAR